MSTLLAGDELWAVVKPLLPKEPPNPKDGQRRVHDRAPLTGINFVLKTDASWVLPLRLRHT